MITTVVFFIIGFSVIISYDWRSGGFLPNAPVTILLGVLVGAIIFIAAMYTRGGPVYTFPSGYCPSCRRMVPADSNLCPYCGVRLKWRPAHSEYRSASAGGMRDAWIAG